MDSIKILDLFDLAETVAADLFKGLEYPWEALPRIHDFIIELGKKLPGEIYEERGENIWVARSASVAPTASLNGPLIIDEGAEIRHCAFIRGNAIVGKGAVVGNSTELKNVVLFNKVQVPHYNYVGDSILGFKSHMGDGCHAGRPCGGRLQQRPESRDRHRKEQQYISHVHGAGRHTCGQHL